MYDRYDPPEPVGPRARKCSFSTRGPYQSLGTLPREMEGRDELALGGESCALEY